MSVIIVSRDQAVMEPLIDQLSRQDFKVALAENSAAVMVMIKKGGLQFLLAEPVLLLEHGLAREVFKRYPLARLIALDPRPTLLGLAEALTNGLTDYFPRSPEYFDEVAQLMLSERQRLRRWQSLFLSGPGLTAPDPQLSE
ncbi:MAG: hypothetical protein LBP55_04040 [Candidatus Adiutrix sp.]|jgi:DNA-binding NtrC family response regulator|nr:hypothetical protein [Candidatus Adiutrix sp.]